MVLTGLQLFLLVGREAADGFSHRCQASPHGRIDLGTTMRPPARVGYAITQLPCTERKCTTSLSFQTRKCWQQLPGR